MSTNQSRINPAILNFLMRKRQQQGGWDERLPDNESVGEATSRIAPYIGVNTGLPSISERVTDEPTDGWGKFNPPNISSQPIINRGMNSMSRVAEMPVTDTLSTDDTQRGKPMITTMPNIAARPIPADLTSSVGFPSLQAATTALGKQPIDENAPNLLDSTPIINAAQNYQPSNFQQSVKPIDSKGQDLPEVLSGSPPTPQIIAAQNAPQPTMADRYMGGATPANDSQQPRIAAPTIASSPIIDAARNAEPIEGAPDVRNISPDKIQAAIAPLINAQRDVPLETSSEINTQQPRISPMPYETLANGNVPISPEDTTTRARITDPSQFLINRAIGSLTDQPNYGVDKNGIPRTHAARGFGGRLKAFLKEEGRGIEEGRGVLGAVPRAVHAAANPDIVAQDRLREQQRENYQAAASDIGLQGAQAKVQQEQAAADYMRQRPQIENAKIDSLRQNRTAQRLEQEYRARPTYDPNDPVEQSDPNSLTNRARQMRMSFGKKDAKTRAGFTFGYQRYEYDANGQPHPILEDALKKPVDVKLDDGTTVQMTGEQYGNYRTQRERNDAIAKSQQFNQQKYEESRGLADQDYENKRQTIIKRNQGRLSQIEGLQKERDGLESVADTSESPSAATKARHDADTLTREIEKVKSEVEYEPPARAAAPARSSGASSGGKIYTRAQVQKYADLKFGGDYSKAEANVRAEGYDIQ